MTNACDEMLSEFPTSMPLAHAAQALEYGCEREEEYANRVSSEYLSEEELALLEGLNNSNDSWSKRVKQLREKIGEDLTKAADAGLSKEIYQRKLDYVAQYNNEMVRIGRYLIDIEDELAKGDLSALRIDRRGTEKTGSVLVTIKSLDLWAKSNYGFSSFLPPLPAKGRDKTQRSLNEAEQETGDKSQNESGATKLKNLFVSFALLVDAFAKTGIPGTKYRKSDGTPNVKAIAEFIEDLTKETNKSPPMEGQGHESIKKRIVEAMRVKDANMKRR